MTACEVCRERGITGREAYAYRFRDGQRATLCLSHARVLRVTESPEWRPIAYGARTREAESRGAIVGECVA